VDAGRKNPEWNLPSVLPGYKLCKRGKGGFDVSRGEGGTDPTGISFSVQAAKEKGDPGLIMGGFRFFPTGTNSLFARKNADSPAKQGKKRRGILSF